MSIRRNFYKYLGFASILVAGLLINKPSAAQSSDGETPSSSPASKTWNYLWDTASSSWYRQRSSAGQLIVSGVTTVSTAAVVNSSAAYTTGMAIGTYVTLTGAVRISAGTGLIQSVLLSFVDGVIPACDVVFLNAAPASTITDHATYSLSNATDLAKVIGVVHVTDTTLHGASSPSTLQAENIAMPYNAAAGTSIYAIVVIRASATLTQTSDVNLTVRFLPD